MSGPLVGNGRINDAVCSAVKENRLPHAIIIEGDKGTGRHTLAHFIASAAVCTAEIKPCGVCSSCRLAKAGTHPDIYFTAPDDGKKNISVAQVRS
ncbi:MAG: ATP-binding protein, partial [Acutalibacteraceae bacterium]|nr:ATP-binding protein [Acutalibacteraceae bacterium]